MLQKTQTSNHIFQALAEPNRRYILEMLSEHGEMSATDIVDQFSISGSAVSQHLKILRLANVVTMKKQAQKRLYSVNPEAIQEVAEWIQHLVKLKVEQFNRLDTLLEKLKK